MPIWSGDQVVAALGIVVPAQEARQLRLISALQVAAGGFGRSLRDP